jgi:WD40 repeat protein
MSQAKAGRYSRRRGQRFESLDAIRTATELLSLLDLSQGERAARKAELRNLAIACLALPDARVIKIWGREEWEPGRLPAIDFQKERTFHIDERGDLVLCRLDSGAEITHYDLGLPPGASTGLFQGDDYLWVTVGPNHGIIFRLEGNRFVRVLEEKQLRGWSSSPTFQQLVIMRTDGTLALHELPSGKKLRQFQVKQAPDAGYSIAPDGRRLAFLVASQDRTLQILDLETGKLTGIPMPDIVHTLSWHPDGRTLAIGHLNIAEVALWDVDLRQVVQRVQHSGGGVFVAFNATGELLGTHSGWAGGAYLWHPGTGKQLLYLPGPIGNLYSPPPQGGRLIGWTWTERFSRGKLWEMNPGLVCRTLTGDLRPGRINIRAGFVNAISPNGRLLATFGDNDAVLWDLPTGREVACIRGVRNPKFLPDGSLTAEGGGGLIWPLRTDPGQPDHLQFGPPRMVQVLRPNPTNGPFEGSADGRTLAVGDLREWIHVLRGDPPRLVRSFGPIHRPWSLDVSPDGRWLAAARWHSSDMRVWEIDSGRELMRNLVVTPSTVARQVTFSPDGKWLLALLAEDKGYSIRLWETGSWPEGPRLQASTFSSQGPSFAFAADGQVLAVNQQDTRVRLVDKRQGRIGQELAQLEAPDQDGAVSGLAFTPDGSVLAAGKLNSGHPHIWDLRRIRGELVRLGLDWDAPPYPTEDRAQTLAARRRPLKVQVVSAEGLPNP